LTNLKHTDELRPGVTFVTPTRRLAHHLRARHDAACVKRGLTVWPTPDVVTWTELLRREFEADRVAGRTSCRWLAPVHGQVVFEQIIRRDDRSQAVIAPSGIGAPVINRVAVPSVTGRRGTLPAPTSSITSRTSARSLLTTA
jgi:hypothetical protein